MFDNWCIRELSLFTIQNGKHVRVKTPMSKTVADEIVRMCLASKDIQVRCFGYQMQKDLHIFKTLLQEEELVYEE